MILVVASGKGGTGKTTVSVNLARSLGVETQLLDCDVEEPNARLFLDGKVYATREVTVPVPVVNAARCDGCNACGEFCAYNAIVSFGKAPLVFPEMCHGCGGCMKVCPRQAIGETPKRIGIVERMRSGTVLLDYGLLDVGVAMAPPLIRAVKELLHPDMPAILDAPPGTSCPAIATMRNADAVLLVTEPTPFGLHDLRLAVDVTRELGIPFGVLINRVGVGDQRVHDFCHEEDIPILMEIPDDRGIAEAYSRGVLMVDAYPEYRKLFQQLYRRVEHLVQRYAPAVMSTRRSTANG